MQGGFVLHFGCKTMLLNAESGVAGRIATSIWNPICGVLNLVLQIWSRRFAKFNPVRKKRTFKNLMEQENVNVPLTIVRYNLCNINVETRTFMINLYNSYPECHWFESDRRYQQKPVKFLTSLAFFCLPERWVVVLFQFSRQAETSHWP